MSRIREYLALTGKTGDKVIAVFAPSAEAAARVARHVRVGAPSVALWLVTPRRVEAPDYERVLICVNAVEAQKALWPRWVALSVAVWDGTPGGLKLSPLAVPPFRAVVMNEHGDFFAATPRAILRHAARRLLDAATSARNRQTDVSRGAFLWLFAFVAQRFIWLSRTAFRKFHGRQSLSIDAPPSGEGVLQIRHGRRKWNWDVVASSLRSSDRRWVLFLEDGADSAVDDLIPLFDDPRTFAVARQMDYRDWNLGLFARAPFRRLQPGEVSQVLAPLSKVMLFDRTKLLALGIPKTVAPGSAWLLVFWKAAAAGWRSYSAGGDSTLEESADWPYEEAEFVTRVLADPELRKLGPREPDLARGSIALTWQAKPPAPRRPRVLIVSPYLPYPLSHGGAVRMYNLCRALRDRVDFTLACFREKDEAVEYGPLHEVFREVYIVDRDERASLDLSLPRQVREHPSASLHALIQELQGRVDWVQVEFTHMAGFRPEGSRSILVEHDITFTLYRQFAEQRRRAEDQREYGRWLRFERAALQQYDLVWTMSEQDRAAAIGEGSPAGRALVIPNGVDLDRFTALPPGATLDGIFYMGSFRHSPNIIGFDRLRHEILPRVWQRFPEATLRVVAGPDYVRYWREFSRNDAGRRLDSRIEVHGFVADPRPLYAQSAVVAVPLLVSAGTNIKVMEAMACGRAIVSTTVGCQGLGLVDGEDILIRDDPAAFADALCELLADGAKRERIATAARRTVEERFSWAAIAEGAMRCYEG